jgi:hypothetical protein
MRRTLCRQVRLVRQAHLIRHELLRTRHAPGIGVCYSYTVSSFLLLVSPRLMSCLPTQPVLLHECSNATLSLLVSFSGRFYQNDHHAQGLKHDANSRSDIIITSSQIQFPSPQSAYPAITSPRLPMIPTLGLTLPKMLGLDPSPSPGAHRNVSPWALPRRSNCKALFRLGSRD